jgi:hypothetical protein
MPECAVTHHQDDDCLDTPNTAEIRKAIEFLSLDWYCLTQ